MQNRSFHVVERTTTFSKYQKMKNARAKRARILFFIVKYANLWGFCCRRRHGCLSSLICGCLKRCCKDIENLVVYFCSLRQITLGHYSLLRTSSSRFSHLLSHLPSPQWTSTNTLAHSTLNHGGMGSTERAFLTCNIFRGIY